MRISRLACDVSSRGDAGLRFGGRGKCKGEEKLQMGVEWAGGVKKRV
jgi:hypothetical protein